MEFVNWLGERLFLESGTRYSIEVNYRTSWQEAQDHFVKLCLGYVMAALKQHGYHVKHVYSQKPLRIIISTKQWEDGEWVGILSFQEKEKCFIFCPGVYSKMRDSASFKNEEVKRCVGHSASEVSREVLEKMTELKKRHPRDGYRLKPALLKRGPKK